MKLILENWRRYLLTESSEGLKNPYEDMAALTWQGSGAASVPKPEQMWDRHHDYESAAARVGDQVYDKAMANMYDWIVATLPKEGVLTGKQQGEQYEKFQRKAFNEISPPEFETLEAFVAEYSRELDEKEERLERNLNILQAKQLPAPTGPPDIQMNEGNTKTKLLFENWREYLNENSATMSEDEWIDFMENEFEESETLTRDVFDKYLRSRIAETRVMPSIEEVREWYYGLKSLLDPEDRSHIPQYERTK